MTATTAPTLDDWLARAAAVTPRNELFIDGRFQPSASGRTFDGPQPNRPSRGSSAAGICRLGAEVTVPA